MGAIVMVLGAVFTPLVVMSDDISLNDPRLFAFSWPQADKTDTAPRGGSTGDEPIKLAKSA